MRLKVLLAALLVSGCAGGVQGGSRVLFQSTAVTPVVVEQQGDQLIIKYKSKTETAGVIITQDDKVIVDVSSLTPKKGAGSILLDVFEIVVNAVVEAVF